MHIDVLRAIYSDARYPGDLAGEVLPARFPWRRVAWVSSSFGMGSLAAAAAIVLLASHLNLNARASSQRFVEHRVVEVADHRLAQVGLRPLSELPRLAQAIGLNEYDNLVSQGVEQLRRLVNTAPAASSSDEPERARS